MILQNPFFFNIPPPNFFLNKKKRSNYPHEYTAVAYLGDALGGEYSALSDGFISAFIDNPADALPFGDRRGKFLRKLRFNRNPAALRRFEKCAEFARICTRTFRSLRP